MVLFLGYERVADVGPAIEGGPVQINRPLNPKVVLCARVIIILSGRKDEAKEVSNPVSRPRCSGGHIKTEEIK
jgi:hypothetical protein